MDKEPSIIMDEGEVAAMHGERKAARAEGEESLAEGAWFVKTVTAVLAAAVIVASLGVFGIVCIAAVKGIAWAVGW